MRGIQIILTQLVFLAGCHQTWGQPTAPATPPLAAPYPATPAPTVFVPSGQPYYQGPMLVPTQPTGPMVYPQPSVLPGSVVVPQPMTSQPPVGFAPPGVMGVPPAGAPLPPGAIVDPAAPAQIAPNPEMQSLGPNPIVIPVTNDEVAWDQIVDVMSDYFTVVREQRARRDGEAWSEGLIETAPLDGATWLEPFRKDSVGSFNRWESTFQTIRRRAMVRVIPESAGYQVELIVEKELEDLPTPERASVGAAVFRGETSERLPSRRLEGVDLMPSSPRWLLLGRDPLLEQRILADIAARFGGTVR
jgi:hypothetical protein